MNRIAALILPLATLAFIASTMSYALSPVGGSGAIPSDLNADTIFGNRGGILDLAGQFMQPQVTAMLALLVLTWITLAYHAVRKLREQFRPGISATPLPVRNEAVETGMLIAGLVAGAIWPWLREDYPMQSFLLCAAMLSGFLGAALMAIRLGDTIRMSNALGFAAGWATLVTCALFATLLQTQLGASTTLAASIAILIAALATVNVQLHLGQTISYSIAVIWGMIGLAAGSVAAEAALAMLAVLAIAVIAVALVRVTT